MPARQAPTAPVLAVHYPKAKGNAASSRMRASTSSRSSCRRRGGEVLDSAFGDGFGVFGADVALLLGHPHLWARGKGTIARPRSGGGRSGGAGGPEMTGIAGCTPRGIPWRARLNPGREPQRAGRAAVRDSIGPDNTRTNGNSFFLSPIPTGQAGLVETLIPLEVQAPAGADLLVTSVQAISVPIAGIVSLGSLFSGHPRPVPPRSSPVADVMHLLNTAFRAHRRRYGCGSKALRSVAPLSLDRYKPSVPTIHQFSPVADGVGSAATIAITPLGISPLHVVQDHTSPPRSQREMRPGTSGCRA